MAFSAIRELALPEAAETGAPPRTPLPLGGIMPTRREEYVLSAEERSISDSMDSKMLMMVNPNPDDG